MHHLSTLPHAYLFHHTQTTGTCKSSVLMIFRLFMCIVLSLSSSVMYPWNTIHNIYYCHQLYFRINYYYNLAWFSSSKEMDASPPTAKLPTISENSGPHPGSDFYQSKSQNRGRIEAPILFLKLLIILPLSVTIIGPISQLSYWKSFINVLHTFNDIRTIKWRVLSN